MSVSAEGLAEPLPQRRRTVMIPSIVAWSMESGSAKPSQREKLRTRALHDENVRGGQGQPYVRVVSRFVQYH